MVIIRVYLAKHGSNRGSQIDKNMTGKEEAKQLNLKKVQIMN